MTKEVSINKGTTISIALAIVIITALCGFFYKFGILENKVENIEKKVTTIESYILRISEK